MSIERALEALLEEGRLPSICVFGLNHTRAPVELREAFTLEGPSQSAVLDKVLASSHVREAVAIGTCNRSELVVVSHGDLTGGESLLRTQEDLTVVFERVSGLSRKEFKHAIYFLTGREAVNHLFRVACGLDSMILGEPQILGQLKACYQRAHARRASGALLNRLFPRAFGVAKAVRTRTKIGHRAVSVCYAAKDLALQIFGDLSESSVMLIGAGDTGELALKHFRGAGVREFIVVNKTLAKAVSLAQQVGGAALELSHLSQLLSQADIVIGASTLEQAAPRLITREMAVRACKERPGKPQLYLDLGVPRNFAADIGDLSDAFLYNIDDLQTVVSENLDARVLEQRRAEIIIEEEVEKFLSWLELQGLEPLIREVEQRFQLLRQLELAKTKRRLRRAGLTLHQLVAVEEALQALTRSLMSKALHGPFRALKKNAVQNPAVVDTFKEFFLTEGETGASSDVTEDEEPDERQPDEPDEPEE